MLEIGSLVDGKYKILNKVGQGGMSVVYLAMNEKANKQLNIFIFIGIIYPCFRSSVDRAATS